MINGAHVVVYSKDPEADREFLRDILGLPHVDAGEGWLIFGLPPAEVAIHPSRRNDVHELYLMCADIRSFVARMKKSRIRCGPVQQMAWGRLVTLTLPAGGKLGVYEPLHARPKSARVPRPARSRAAARKRRT